MKSFHTILLLNDNIRIIKLFAEEYIYFIPHIFILFKYHFKTQRRILAHFSKNVKGLVIPSFFSHFSNNGKRLVHTLVS